MGVTITRREVSERDVACTRHYITIATLGGLPAPHSISTQTAPPTDARKNSGNHATALMACGSVDDESVDPPEVLLASFYTSVPPVRSTPGARCLCKRCDRDCVSENFQEPASKAARAAERTSGGSKFC